MAKDNGISRERYEMVKKDAAEKIGKLNDRLKLANESWGGTSPAEGIAAAAIGSTHAILARWSVEVPVVGQYIGKVKPLSVLYTAAWPMVRKGLSKSLRRRGDQLWQYGISRTAEDATNRGFDALMNASKA